MGKWKDNGTNQILKRKGYYLSYCPNNFIQFPINSIDLDSSNPETAIVIPEDKPDGSNRFLIFRGDRRKELEKIKSLKKLKEYWREHGGHFWSDDLED